MRLQFNLICSKLIQESPDFQGVVENGLTQGTDPNQIWGDFVNTLSNKLLVHLGAHLAERLANARLFDLFHSLGSAAALYTVLAPFFVSYSHYVQQRVHARRILEGLHRNFTNEKPLKTKVAHFTDTFFEVNGVARTLQQQLESSRKLGKEYCIITCDTRSKEHVEGLNAFAPVGSWKIPDYPEIELYVPPFLQLLKYCYTEGFTHIHTSTPGPMGLAALGIARILQLPISGTYHTAMPQYGRILTEDSYVEELLWKGMTSFYDQLDAVFSPSKATAQELIDRSLSQSKIVTYPRGVNVKRFHPDKKNPDILHKYTCGNDAPVFLYVGRISKEKSLDLLAETFRLLCNDTCQAQLMVVGDGPYREEMEGLLAECPAIFTGYVEGDELPALYASSDVFVFPSATDTFGNVVLEAQASGIPVIVSNQGGPMENMLPEKTGLIFESGNADHLLHTMKDLLHDTVKRNQFSLDARRYIETRSFQNAFSTLYDMYTSDYPCQKSTHMDLMSHASVEKAFSASVA